jgi:hypothetical protein
MAVTAGPVTTAAINNASATTTFSFVSNGSPLYLVGGWWRATRTLNTVTYGGVALTRVAQSAASNGDDIAEIWRLLTPTAGTANIVATWSAGGQQSGSLGAFSVDGQDGSTPEGTAASNTSAAAGTTTGNLAITGAATGDLTIAGVTNGGGAAITPAATGGGTVTELFDLTSNGEQSEAFKVPDAATQVSATFASNSWAIAAIPLKALTSTTLAPTGVDSEEALGSASLAQDSVQTAGPVSDVAAGAWTPSTGVDLFAMVDEPAIDDTDWIASSVNPQADLAELALGPLTDPGSSDGHVVQYRIRLVS